MTTPEQVAAEIGGAIADLQDTQKEVGGEIASALADIVALLEKDPDTKIADALVGVVNALEHRDGVDLSPLVKAITSMKAPQVSVNVAPTPVHFEVPHASGWEFDIKYAPQGQIAKIVAKRV